MEGLKPKHVVIVGGGVAALEAMLALRNLVGSKVSIDLVSPQVDFVYRPYSVLSPFGLAEVRRINLSSALAANSVNHVRESLVEVRAQSNRIVTDSGKEITYDWLILAHGASASEGVAGALTFDGEYSVEIFRELLLQVALLKVRRLAFVIPPGDIWHLPLYELALHTRHYAVDHGIEGLEISIVTTEARPLEIFGNKCSAAVSALLLATEINVVCDCSATDFLDGVLKLASEEELYVDAVVTLPRLSGHPLKGLRCDQFGFLSTDRQTRVEGYRNIFAVGDCVSFPIKQGGIATQQADAAVEAIAEELGLLLNPKPFSPVLRGVLLTGDSPRYMSTVIAGASGNGEVSASTPLWWPPGKISGKYFTPFIKAQTDDVLLTRPPTNGIKVEVQLERLVSARCSGG